MFPKITELELPIIQPQEAIQLGKSFLFDFRKGDFVLENGRIIVANELQALQIWIEKTLRTEKFKFIIYEEIDYGVTLDDLIGQVYSYAFTESEVKREVNEALTKHPQIESISQLSINRSGSKTTITFKVNLRDGQYFDKEVSY